MTSTTVATEAHHDVTTVVGQARNPVTTDLAFAAAVLIALTAAVAASRAVEVAPVVREMALFVHLAALVLGLGSVLAIDWFGMRWMLGKTSLEDMLSITAALTLPIWLGLAGLVASGVVLRPTLSNPLVVLKLALVAIVAINGVHARALHRAFVRLPHTARRGHRRRRLRPEQRLLMRAMASGAISQFCWWSAAIIGFLNARP